MESLHLWNAEPRKRNERAHACSDSKLSIVAVVIGSLFICYTISCSVVLHRNKQEVALVGDFNPSHVPQVKDIMNMFMNEKIGHQPITSCIQPPWWPNSTRSSSLITETASAPLTQQRRTTKGPMTWRKLGAHWQPEPLISLTSFNIHSHQLTRPKIIAENGWWFGGA